MFARFQLYIQRCEYKKMSELQVEERSVVIPGEILAEGMDFLPGDNTYRKEQRIYSKTLGSVSVSGRVLKIIPLAGPYLPRVGDRIIGRVKDILMSGWRINFGSAYSAVMNVKDASTRFIKKREDLSKILDIGDIVFVQISNVTSQNLIDIIMTEPGLKRLTGGRIIKISSQKVPRVIGKKGSMITLVKDKSGCEINVGQNGLVSIRGTPDGEYLAERAIKLIEKEAHLSGLTEKMTKFLAEAK